MKKVTFHFKNDSKVCIEQCDEKFVKAIKSVDNDTMISTDRVMINTRNLTYVSFEDIELEKN